MVNSTASSAEILSKADYVLGEAGLQHRHISITNEALGLDLTPDFVSGGYERETLTTMIYRGAQVDGSNQEVEAVSLDTLRPALTRDWRLLLPDSDDDVHVQLVNRTELYERGAAVDRLVVFSEGQIAARLEFFLDAQSGIAQLENLFTHEWYLRIGFAKGTGSCDFTKAP